jgi:hypothetical protein
MNYDILQAKIEFADNKITRITVLVDCTGKGNPHTKPFSDVRAIYATTKPRGGYMNIPASAKLSDQLLQDVAAAGLETDERDKIFPGWKEKLTQPSH